jgi:hypothetical protein
MKHYTRNRFEIVFSAINDQTNVILMRQDLHTAFNQYQCVLVPKAEANNEAPPNVRDPSPPRFARTRPTVPQHLATFDSPGGTRVPPHPLRMVRVFPLSKRSLRPGSRGICFSQPGSVERRWHHPMNATHIYCSQKRDRGARRPARDHRPTRSRTVSKKGAVVVVVVVVVVVRRRRRQQQQQQQHLRLRFYSLPKIA